MKDFFDTWKFKILVGIAVFLVGIMAYAGANGRLTAAPQELLSVAAAPFQKVAAVVSGGVASLWEKYTSIDDVMAENETLKAENAELRQQMVDYDRVKAENQAYKALESIQSQRPEMSYLSSFVIGRDPLDSFYGFTLDRGTLDGVAVNDAVVSDQGYLLGMVVEAEPTSCKVMTILHPNFNAAGVVSRTRDNGIVTGSSEYAADGLCVLTNLARNTLPEKSDQVVTTGLGWYQRLAKYAWAGWSRLTCWWAWYRNWCPRSAANRPLPSSNPVPTPARCAMRSSLPASEEGP